MKRPDDIRATFIGTKTEIETPTTRGLSIEMFPNPARWLPGCDTYWGSHGCSRPHGHEGDHWCDCCDCDDHPDEDSGCVAGPPYYGASTTFYGDDA